MHPSSRPSVPPRLRRFDNRHIESKQSHGIKKEDKNMNTASPRRVTRAPPESSRLKGPSQGARAPVAQPKLVRPQRIGAQALPAISKPKSGRAVSNLAPAVDPNCNEPSLPCLCCDDHSPQDSNSLFNHNHNNNNTVTISRQMKLPPPPPQMDKLAVLKQDVKEDECKMEVKQPLAMPVEKRDEVNGNMDEKDADHLKNNDSGVSVKGNIDVNGNGRNDDDEDDDEDDDTLVPSCGNCPESMLDFSLTSSTSSSSTSISSCSDLECDCPDTFSLSSQDQDVAECYQSTHSLATHCSSFESSVLPMDHNTLARPPLSPVSIDEGYPSAPSSPCSDFADKKGLEEGRCIKVNLLNFLDSMEELGKVDLFYRIVKLAQWELDNELIVRDRLNHQQKLQRVNKEVKLAYLLKLQDEGLDFNNEDIPKVLDEMGNIDISWNLYKSNKSCDSQEFSDAGVDLTVPSDLDETSAPDSLSASPLDLLPPPRPPKPPKRQASAQLESHIYQNISEHVFSNSSSNEITSLSGPTLPTLSSSPSALKPPALPPPPSQPVPYFTLNTDSTTLPSPTPPIPPPRRRHKARLEAQRLAELERETTTHCLPPPSSRPPPLPPPPALTTPPAIPPPPSVPPPPSFHALDVEIRKLLALAGLTQAELLKLSPELGVCVDVVLEKEKDSQLGELKSEKKENGESVKKESDSRLIEATRVEEDTSLRVKELVVITEKQASTEEQKAANRTTSFTEMARRRKKNVGNGNHSCGCSFGYNVTLSPNSYCSTGLNTRDIPEVSFGSFDYTSIMSDTPPPPPPRPLPPCPLINSNQSEFSSLKSCTLSANASRPERFDWLIAFTPDSPPFEMRKLSDEGNLQKTTSGSTGSKVTTFKELRHRSKHSSPPAPVLPEPDPTVVTPDPDFLYNLKWRREKNDGDGWEYTSQAQASFLQPPATPASLSLFREMRHLNMQDSCPTKPKIGCSISEGSLRTIGCEIHKEDQPKKLEDGEKLEVRGMADGAWTLESRTTVSSPPLSLSTSYSLSSPYFLHSGPTSQTSQFYHTDSNRHHDIFPCGGSMNISKPPCINSTFDPSRKYIDFNDSLYLAETENNSFLLYNYGSDSHAYFDSLHHECNHASSFMDSLYPYHDSDNEKNNFYSMYNNEMDSMQNEDSLYYDGSYTRNSLKLFTDSEPPTHINTLKEGDVTPYKNIDMQSYITMRNLQNQSYANNNTYRDTDTQCDLPSEPCYTFSDRNSNKSTTQSKQEVLSYPAYYLYHPKNCPMHKGEPPRLSPVGAISPPHRSGPPIPGTDFARLCSPLFPRRYTLPALAAPLYYPYLYTPPVQAPVQEPPVPIHHSPQTPPPHHLIPTAVRSFSFAGSEKTNASWMGDDARPSMRTEGLSSACLQEKRTLVSSVSLAVEAILAQFNSSRTLVQKTLSGDSSVNPSLGRLVLQCLCPALRSLLCDGLKPHQSDLIAGRRPNSPWALVLASTKLGPSTQALHNLQAKVAGLPQLKHSRHRFNAFLFGLLNNKLLDYWLSHLHSCCDVLETFYRPSSFMRLSLTSCQFLFEELIVLLQPLSLLTFNLDLLFQHHHLDTASPTLTPASHICNVRSPPNEDLGFYLSHKGPFQGSDHNIGSFLKQDHGSLNPNAGIASLSSHALDVFEESTCRNPFLSSSKEEASSPFSWVKGNDMSGILGSGGSGESLSQQAGQALQQGWGAVMRLGERLGQNFGLAASCSPEDVKGPLDDQKTGYALPPKSPVENRQQPRENLSLWDRGTTVPWNLGRLFGASKSPNNPPTSRRPSQWLSPGVSVFNHILNLGQDSSPEKRELQRKIDKEKYETSKETRDQPMPLRVVRTLCDHTGTGKELSFRKGENLVLLGGLDHDWIKCLQGDKEGLVPIGYASIVI